MGFDEAEDVQPVFLALAGAALRVAPGEEFAGEGIFKAGNAH